MIYLHHRIDTAPRSWKAVAGSLAALRATMAAQGGSLFGIWRSQIGRPRDELTAITCWPDADVGRRAMDDHAGQLENVVDHDQAAMSATLRPADATPPERQGNYAFRHFQTPAEHWPEFLTLCEGAWPDFESSYDSQVIGLWRFADESGGGIRSLLLTRRPDLAMWERSKLPQGAVEAEVRRKLNRRYDLCESTVVYTTTLLTAADREDDARWT